MARGCCINRRNVKCAWQFTNQAVQLHRADDLWYYDCRLEQSLARCAVKEQWEQRTCASNNVPAAV
jgi:hypothetical protein